MELFIIAATIAVICRDPAGTIRAATNYKRAQIEKARAKNPKVRHPGHRALRNYLGTVWEAEWNAAAERYPEKMQAAQARRAARRASKAGKKAGGSTPPKPTPPKGTPKSTAPKTASKPAAPKPAAAPAPVPAGVVDLDEARRRRAADDTVPEMGPVPDEGNPIMSLNLSDSTSLRGHLAALREHASYQDRTCTAKEQLGAGMRESGVGEGTVGAVDASRAASAHAAAMARAAADALEAANMPVAEARASSPDAGAGDYYERR